MQIGVVHGQIACDSVQSRFTRVIYDKAVIFIRLVGKDHCADTSDYGAYIHNSWTRFRFLEQKEECVRSDCCTKDVDGENLLEDCAEATRSDLAVFSDTRIVDKYV